MFTARARLHLHRRLRLCLCLRHRRRRRIGRRRHRHLLSSRASIGPKNGLLSVCISVCLLFRAVLRSAIRLAIGCVRFQPKLHSRFVVGFFRFGSVDLLPDSAMQISEMKAELDRMSADLQEKVATAATNEDLDRLAFHVELLWATARCLRDPYVC